VNDVMYTSANNNDRPPIQTSPKCPLIKRKRMVVQLLNQGPKPVHVRKVKSLAAAQQSFRDSQGFFWVSAIRFRMVSMTELTYRWSNCCKRSL